MKLYIVGDARALVGELSRRGGGFLHPVRPKVTIINFILLNN